MAEENWDEEVVAEPTPLAAEPVVPEVPCPALFGKWNPEEVNVSDMSLTVRDMTNSQA